MDFGLEEFSKILIDSGIKILAVATLEEAKALREINKEIEILDMSSTAIKEDLEELVENNITITIGSKEAAKILNEIAKNGKKIKAHIKIDTGFGRYGFLYRDKETIINTIKNLDNNIEVEGIFTHFSIAYYKNNKHTKKQYEAFLNVLAELEKEKIKIELKHACNSPAFINYPEMRLNAARIGSAFLGRVDSQNSLELKKIGQLKSHVSEIKILPKNFNIGYLNTYKTKKETKVAIIPLGYIDGYNKTIKNDMFRTVDKLRNLKHSITNLIKKQRLTVEIEKDKYTIIGKIGMFHFTADITKGNVKVGSEAFLEVSPMHVDSSVRREYI